MTNARRTTKSARRWFCCGEATGTTQNVVRIWWLSAVTLVFGLLAAAPVRAVCINDGQGPDDQPGQKDLSGLCEPGPACSSSATTLSLLWQFDDVNWTGSNTGDACALIDLNQDGLADRAVCVTVFGAAQMAGKCSNNQFLGCRKNQDCGSGGTCVLPTDNTGPARCYTCANDRPTRCSNSQPVSCTSVCGVGVAVGADPFTSSATHTANKCNGSNCLANDAAVNCCLTSTDIGTGGQLIDVCSYPSQQPNSDPSDCVITPPNCSSDADCDDHNPCTVDMCITGSGGAKFCDNPPGNAGTVCRASTGACDVAETCTGTNRDCLDDGFAPATTICRTSAGPCDVAESCTGTGTACPADGFASVTTVCRASAGPCDAVETCTGSSATCPADSLPSAATICQAAAGPCDAAETCTGSSATCPADSLQSAGTLCRAAAGPCDVAETCSGSSANCPADGVQSAGTLCRAAAGPCDVAETCTGSSASCPADGFKSAAVVCRPSVGDCDVAEKCPGDGPNCPPDGFEPSTFVCRQVYCPGNGTACP